MMNHKMLALNHRRR
jgi:hypothetical protein